MGYRLVITEKPSVAAAIAKVIGATERKDGYFQGSGYLVSWCVGHLVELAMPQAYDEKYGKWRKEDLPILPEKWKYQIYQSTKKQFQTLKSLMARKDVTELCCATDAGREGELIFRLVYHQAGCRKPFRRLWISSMEDSAIREGFQNLKPSAEYDALYNAALCRERADWIIGINASRLYSCLYDSTLNVGRVVTPTLAMLVEREEAIKAFVPELFYTVQLQTDAIRASSKRFSNKADAEVLAAKCREDHQVRVDSVETKEKTEKPPLLYDLTSLQRDANKVLGFSAQQTLDTLQSLYEKKLVTYPRTDSRFLTEDMAPSLPELVYQAAAALDYAGDIPVHAGQVINNAKVTDHHAVIPTRELSNARIAELPKAESEILKLVAVRFMAAAGDPCRYEETAIKLSCAGEAFTVKGKTILNPGWKEIVEHFYPAKEKDAEALPRVQEGMIIPLAKAEVKDGKTKPQQHFTEGSLLHAMETAGAEDIPDDAERKGLGTPATRAGIIEKLIQRGFAVRSGDKKTKILLPTEKGVSLVTVVPEKLKSPMMTAEWEQKLLQMERQSYDSACFMEEIGAFVRELVDTAEVDPSISFAPSFHRKAKKGRKR
ncbi:MAG: DNA topoisomerase 3 [Acidaminococcaceae bacterium]|jgi:DNA topoisomerase-3|nr:DNA topoisomerase 3 [Acidaminococcaceae bacterium]